ncbi:guanylate-binding protein [Gigaspora rosea]|uniref:Guanylate-binding protein n=1 Tax=Gigaspora rosea TaxID=44941 RepID=A0A397UF63_9GLOM|nr:guanylate-binding protein [Gigaspora rosea]
MSSNPFSKTIPFRSGNPIHLLNYISSDKGGAILLDEQALRVFRNIEEPIAVISVGIDIWDTPFYNKGKQVVIIDCEGIDDPNQEVPWANKLFILCLAISSTLIYNINGIIGRDGIEKLFLMTKIVSLIQPPNNYQFLPSLVVLLRDFQLDSPPDFVEYFLDRLSKVNYDATKEITKFFKKFDVYPIPHPGVRQEAMRNMSIIETDQLDPIFVEKIEKAVTNIFEGLPPKYLNASEMTGVTFAEFLERCVEQINDPTNTMLSIPSAYEATINYAVKKAYDSCLELYNEMMVQMSFCGLPIPWNEFEDVHNVAFEFAFNNFIQQIIGRFEEAIELFEQTYGTIIMPGLEALRVLNEFKANQYEEAIKLLNNYGILHEERANEILARQETEKKIIMNFYKKKKI